MNEEEKENITDSNEESVPIHVTTKERLGILKNVLYWGGGFYLLIGVAIVILSQFSIMPSSTELTILITVLGSILTTIVGVIVGSSIR